MSKERDRENVKTPGVRLKKETAFRDPGSLLNPAELPDCILNDYFRIAGHFRRKSSGE